MSVSLKGPLFKCPITLSLLRDPVCFIPCGHTVNKNIANTHILYKKGKQEQPTCPVCRKKLKRPYYVINVLIQKILDYTLGIVISGDDNTIEKKVNINLEKSVIDVDKDNIVADIDTDNIVADIDTDNIVADIDTNNIVADVDIGVMAVENTYDVAIIDELYDDDVQSDARSVTEMPELEEHEVRDNKAEECEIGEEQNHTKLGRKRRRHGIYKISQYPKARFGIYDDGWRQKINNRRLDEILSSQIDD